MKMAGWRWWADRASPVASPWPANMHRILTLNLSKGEAPDGRLWRSSFDQLRTRAFIRAAAHPSGRLPIEQHDTAVQRQAATVERGGELLASDGWKPERHSRIVGHGGYGRLDGVDRVGSTTKTYATSIDEAPSFSLPNGSS